MDRMDKYENPYSAHINKKCNYFFLLKNKQNFRSRLVEDGGRGKGVIFFLLERQIFFVFGK